jgi:hypothetical protein
MEVALRHREKAGSILTHLPIIFQNCMTTKIYSSMIFATLVLLALVPLTARASGTYGYYPQYSNYDSQYAYGYMYPSYTSYSYPDNYYNYNYNYSYPQYYSYPTTYSYPTAYSTYAVPTYSHSYSYNNPHYGNYGYGRQQWVYCYPTQYACGNIAPQVTYDYSYRNNYHNYNDDHSRYYGVSYGGYDGYHRKSHY